MFITNLRLVERQPLGAVRTGETTVGFPSLGKLHGRTAPWPMSLRRASHAASICSLRSGLLCCLWNGSGASEKGTV